MSPLVCLKRKPGLKRIFWHKIGELLTSGNISIGNFISKWYKTKATIISYGAVDNEIKNISLKKKSKIIYFGRLAEDTGILEYLKAVKVLNNRIDIYGDGPQMEGAKIFSRKNSLKAKFLGFVPNINKYLSSYQVAFVANYLGILESLATKVPVIAYYHGPMKKDYLTLTPFSGFIKICSNTDEIVRAYKDIVDNNIGTQTSVKAGYNWVKTQTWEKLAGEYEQLWQGKIVHPNPQ